MNILSTFDTMEPEVTSRLTSRRAALGAMAKLGAAAVTAPILLAALSQEAFGNGPAMPAGVFDVLNFALLLEHLEDEFYSKALQAPGLIPARDQAIFQRVSADEGAHVKLLSVATLAPVLTHKFDYTAGGRYPDVFRNYRTFLGVAQAFEDTGVRAYKGQATNLMHASLILSIALRIHSVEARHACEIRRIRGQKGWITGSSRGNLPAAMQPIYNGEGNTQGLYIEGIGSDTISEAFDEPLSKDQVLHIVHPFIH